MALCGKVFLHEVQDWMGGERVCVAHYMKDFVHERLGVPRPALPREDDYHWKIDLEYNLKMFAKIALSQSLKGLNRTLGVTEYISASAAHCHVTSVT